MKGDLFKQIVSLLSNPRKIVDCATRTLLVSYNAVCSSKLSGGKSQLTLSIYLEEDLDVLVNACGNGRCLHLSRWSTTIPMNVCLEIMPSTCSC